MSIKKIKKEIFKKLISSPNDWRFNEYWAAHQPTGLMYRIGNGFLSFRCQQGIKIGFWNKLKLWRFLKYSRLHQIIHPLEIKIE